MKLPSLSIFSLLNLPMTLVFTGAQVCGSADARAGNAGSCAAVSAMQCFVFKKNKEEKLTQE